MADRHHSTPDEPVQRGLRSFIVYDDVPPRMTAFPITDDLNEPHLHTGDWVIVDPSDTEPSHGEIFIVEWKTAPGRPRPMQVSWMRRMACWAAAYASPTMMVERAGSTTLTAVHIGDFGYGTEYMRDVIKGRVIGILEAHVQEPLRSGQGAA
jgi:hypothetical protein